MNNSITNIFYLPVRYGFIINRFDQITHCVGEGSYTRIFFTDNKSVLATKRLNVFEHLLKDFNFIRCHKSCLVNPMHIKEYCCRGKENIILSNGVAIKVACRKHREFKYQMMNNFITIPA